MPAPVKFRLPTTVRGLGRVVLFFAMLTSTGCAVDPPAPTRTASVPAESIEPAGDRGTARPFTDEPSDRDGSARDSASGVRASHASRAFTVVVNGDVLLHEGLWATARADAARTGRGDLDFRPLFSHMRPVFHDADLSICHLETPLALKGGPYLGYPLFSAPPQITPALRWAGFDACTIASNHTVDQGFDGIRRTVRALDGVGIAHTGAFSTRGDSRVPLMLVVNGVRVALLSATYGLNGLPMPDGRPWAVNIIDPDRLIRQARSARRAGARLVLAALHWGDEYVTLPSGYQRDVARRLASSGQFDLIYGHHAHVVQPYEKIGGTWVLYGQGNAVAQQSTEFPGLYDGNTARVTFARAHGERFRVTRVQYLPTRVTHYASNRPMRYLNVPRALTQSRFRHLHDDLADTLSRVRAAIAATGALDQGVTLDRAGW